MIKMGIIITLRVLPLKKGVKGPQIFFTDNKTKDPFNCIVLNIYFFRCFNSITFRE